MKQINSFKIVILILILTIGFFGFSSIWKSEMQTTTTNQSSKKIIEGKDEVKGYKSWTKVNNKPEIMVSKVAMLCAMPTNEQVEVESKNPHNDKFINVYVNAIGKDEMMTKKYPQFPKGTVIVKEKLTTSDSTNPEILTVMIKREKDFNPENGDWEYMTLNGDATEVTARGKIESCQACHVLDRSTDYVSRRYLPYEIRQKLK
jgi:hypothetical protein